ncbi:MAG: ribosomal-processing cysteine protease Prp, partial [Clostridia bacterium]|nr:ribosomal-processing cysteine protease Prp [Clostridia bacterium]
MTKARFLVKDGAIYGFYLEGHSTENAGDDEGRALCAAVSSAAYMAANTITEVIGDKAEARVSEGEMFFEVKSPSNQTEAVLKGLKLHLSELQKQYGTRL